MSNFVAVSPLYNTTVSISSVSSTSQSVALGSNGTLLYVCNGDAITGQWMFVRLGDSSVVATVADIPVAPGTCIWLDRNPNDDTHAAVICQAAEAVDIAIFAQALGRS